MAYNRLNLLLKIKDINEIYFKYDALGVSAENIFRLHVYPTYKVSRATFFNYLKTPYHKDLEIELNKKAARESAKAAQKRLFDE